MANIFILVSISVAISVSIVVVISVSIFFVQPWYASHRWTIADGEAANDVWDALNAKHVSFNQRKKISKVIEIENLLANRKLVTQDKKWHNNGDK